MNAVLPNEKDAALRQATTEIRSLRERLKASEARLTEPIAIAGMGCRFPGGRTPEAFLAFLLRDAEAVTEFPPERTGLHGHYDPDPSAGQKIYQPGRLHRRPRPVLPGQGSQYPNLGRELYETQLTFRAALDSCAASLSRDHGIALRAVLYPETKLMDPAASPIHQTGFTQPALFALEWSLAQLWQSSSLRRPGLRCRCTPALCASL